MIPKELKEIVDDIKAHEGYRPRVYKCTEGYDTIGIGFAIKDLVLSESVCDIILMEKLHDLLKRLPIAFPWFNDIHPIAKNVIINMCYQMDIRGFSKFKKTIYLLETEQYEDASIEMLDSLWAREQTPNRAKQLSEKLRSINGHTKNSD